MTEKGPKNETSVQELEKVRAELASALAENRTLKKELADLEKRVVIDSLTGIFNSSSLESRFEDLVSELNYEGEEKRSHPVKAVVVIYLDVNQFKKINDTHGHPAGDSVLKAVALRLKQITKRRIDQVFRVGGDEFVALLAMSDDNEQMLQAILEGKEGNGKPGKRQLLSGIKVQEGNKEIAVNLAMGYEILKKGTDKTYESVIVAVDQKMYIDKQS
jgi:diguanylate cyclase (GGDEF)-like protein